MSMQAYLDNITAKTGKTPEEFVALAKAEGLLAPGVKAGQIVAWLKNEIWAGTRARDGDCRNNQQAGRAALLG